MERHSTHGLTVCGKTVTVCTPITEVEQAEFVAWLILQAAGSKKTLANTNIAAPEPVRNIPVLFGAAAETRSLENCVEELERRIRALESYPPVREVRVESPFVTGSGMAMHFGGVPQRPSANPFRQGTATGAGFGTDTAYPSVPAGFNGRPPSFSTF